MRIGNARRGFTLLEMMCVVTIIALLAALLLPAVQQARELARRHQCQNNLRQIALAIHHYEGSFRVLPPGGVDTARPVLNQPGVQSIGWTVQILPWLERRALFETFDFGAGAAAPWNALRFSVPQYRCPSNPNENLLDPSLGGQYAGVHHDREQPIDIDNHGLLFLNSSITLRQIVDGQSQTLLVGETHGDALLPWTSGSSQTLRNTSLPFDTGRYTPVPTAPVIPTNLTHVGPFGSFHPGVVQFAFADGSVRPLATLIDAALYQQLGHRADGAPLEPLETLLP